MAKIDTQNIPAELLDQYLATLGEANLWKETERVRKRYPWRLPQMTGPNCISGIMTRGAGVTPFQDAHRKLFCRSGRCYNGQPYSGGATPPNLGARNRSWWYNAAGGSGLWYYDYFIQQTINTYLAANIPDWCYIPPQGDSYVVETVNWPPYGSLYYFICGRGFIWLDNIPYIARPTGARELSLCFDVPPNTLISKYGAWFEVFEITEPWDESTLVWNNRPPFGKLLTKFWLKGSGIFRRIIHIPGDHDIAMYPSTPWKPPYTQVQFIAYTKEDAEENNRRPFWIY